jgi:hypothetical protein
MVHFHNQSGLKLKIESFEEKKIITIIITYSKANCSIYISELTKNMFL